MYSIVPDKLYDTNLSQQALFHTKKNDTCDKIYAQ